MSLEALVEQFSNRDLPPVNKWDPPRERAVNMRIDRAGTWHYNDSAINRPRMAALFSSVLRREGDQYFLVTPTEKLQITVELAPFVVLLLEVSGVDNGQILTFTDNCGNKTIADQDHHLWLGDEQLPYLMVRDNLPALIGRSVYYQMADLLVEHEGAYGVWSSEQFFGLMHDEGEGSQSRHESPA